MLSYMQETLPFFNQTFGEHKKSFRGLWQSNETWGPFNTDEGIVDFLMYTQTRLDHTSVQNYSQVMDSLSTVFVMELILLDSKYFDNTVEITFRFELGPHGKYYD